jgi:lipopolysaccharide export system permease protein
MRTLHLYLTRQVLATLVVTVLVFTLVLLLGNLLREILALLINRQATLGLVAQAILLLIPYVFVFALPMGMLTATLLVFGRFSADQELTAVRAGGISLLSLVTPILLLSVALSVLCGWFNLQIAPQCRLAYKALLERQGLSQTQAILAEDRFIESIKDWVIYAGKIQGDHLREIRLYQFKEGEKILDVRAAEGTWHFDPASQALQLNLSNVWIFSPEEPNATNSPPDPSQISSVKAPTWRTGYSQSYSETLFPSKSPALATEKPKISDMTFLQLQAEKRDLDQKGVDTTRVLVQIHRQAAFSFACLGFTLVGIPLGIRAHRRETNVSIALAIVLVLIYYSFVILGQSLEGHPQRMPHLILWLPDFLFQGIGAALLWRANRGV